MIEITRSRLATALLTATAFLYSIGAVLGTLAFAILTPHTVGTSTDLEHASDWLTFVALVAGVVAVGSVGWSLVLRRQIGSLWQVAGGFVATLLLAIGALVAATSNGSQPADVLIAIGVGGWALASLAVAARWSLLEQQPSRSSSRRSPYWLAASGALILVAVGAGIETAIDDVGSSLTSAVLLAVGLGCLLAVLVVARSGKLIGSASLDITLLGVALLAVSYVIAAVVAGVVFGPDVTLNGVRIGIPLGYAVAAIGSMTLSVGAWKRLTSLVVAPPLPPYPRYGGGPQPVHGQGPDVAGPPIRYCVRCGSLLGVGSQFCSQCGTAVRPGPGA